MGDLLEIRNHGPLITETNFWKTDIAHAGKLFASVNAGAIRLLLPRSLENYVNEMRTSKFCVLTRGSWPDANRDDAIEIMFEDHSDSPFCLHLGAESLDLMPAPPEAGGEWVLSVWVLKNEKPHKALERVCHYRRAAIPHLGAWDATNN